ncbi:MAG: hypothetical protein ABR549_03790 [Mycobacteriales bacterium]
MKGLRAASDLMLVLALGFVVVALVGPAWASWVAAFCLLDAVVLTVVRRRVQAARKAVRVDKGRSTAS